MLLFSLANLFQLLLSSHFYSPDFIVLYHNKQEYVGNDGDFFLFLTNVGAPNHHLIEIDIRNKKPRNNLDIVVAVSDLRSKRDSFKS